MQLKNSPLKKKIVDVFVELVTISSPTGKVNAFRDHLDKRLSAYGLIGGKDRYGNLVFRTKQFSQKNSLLLTTHMDTVQPGEGITPVIKGDYIRSDGRTILGADPKAGIAAIIVALDELQKSGQRLRDLEFVFSTNEEEGDHSLRYAAIKSKQAIVFDNSERIEEIVFRSPFAKVFLIEVRGKEVYAQKDYDKGVNAILALARIVDKTRWGFYKNNCVANTGIINGGKATTLVACRATLKGNIYCMEESDLRAYLLKLKNLCQSVDRQLQTKTSIRILESYTGSYLPLNNPLVRRIVQSYEEHGVKPKLVEKLLVGPENCLAEKGIKALNVGIGYQYCHTVKEKQSIPQLVSLTNIITDFIRRDYAEQNTPHGECFVT